MAKSKTNKTIVTNCAEIERLINKIAKELLDREVTPRLESLYGDNKTMKKEIHNLTEQHTKILTDFLPSISELHTKMDVHIVEETQIWEKFSVELTKAATHVQSIQDTLDNVAANGNKGLGASFSDIYGKLKDLEQITQPARVKAKFWSALNNVVQYTPLFKPLKTKWGLIFYSIIIILLGNTLFHSLGVEFDIINIFKWIFTRGRIGSLP